ncbi:SIR2 family protein [Priestia aryabhattai]|uniref:SIR2 family protein n=1 Tax=Priestia aryabhattai TaxID=412384 RepID=UPI002E212BED|nr:SIR2 family protein [Priestia aryabhattai]
MNTEIFFSQMIQELLETDFERVAPPGAICSLDLIIHSSKVYGLDGPVGIYVYFVNEKEKKLSHEIDKMLLKTLYFVEEQYEQAEKIINIPNVIIFTNLEQQSINKFTSENRLKKEFHLWGIEQIKRLLSKYKGILEKYNEIIFIGKLKEELSILSSNHEKRLEQIQYNNGKNITNIKKAFTSGNLSLFLGAGISISAGIPGWKELVSKVYIKALRSKGIVFGDLNDDPNQYWNFTEDINSTDLLIRTKYIKDLIDKDFKDIIRESLYENSSIGSQIITSIVNICNNNKGNIKGIVTYNFDDLLEKNLEMNKIPFSSIWKENQNYYNREIPIYHVHGFIPRDKKINSNIVFSEDEYHQQYLDIYSWSNLVQINMFREYNCLFIGTSLIDPDIRRLLDIAKKTSGQKKHFVIQRRIFSELHLKQIQNNISEVNDVLNQHPEIAFLKRKYKNLKIDDATLRNIMLTEELLIEKDYESLGIKVIWVDNFQEIETVLSLIST